MSTIACSKDYSIVINPQDCPDWLTVAWTGTPGNPPPENVFATTGVVTRNFVGGQFQLQITGETVAAYYADALGTIAYAGSGCNCQVSATMSRDGASESANTGFQILQDATLLLDFRWHDYPAGVGVAAVVPFTILPSAGSTITIRGRWHPVPIAPYFYTYVTGTPTINPTYLIAISNV